MIGTTVIHEEKISMVLDIMGSLYGAPILAIQSLKPNGLIYRVRERPDGFKQYVYVKPSEVVCCG